MSELRDRFDRAARSQQWNDAADCLNGLAMFEMLPALAALGNRDEVVKQIVALLTSRGWAASARRIAWAGEVVSTLKLPSVTPPDLPADQVSDAQKWLRSVPSGGGAARASVMAAVGSGLITGSGANDLNEFTKTGVVTSKKGTGNTVVISDLVFVLIDGLVQGRIPINIMNIARPDDPANSPHGRVQPDGRRISTACDIDVYAGAKIELRPDGANVENTIRGVSGILGNLPRGTYKFGFTRPSESLGGPTHPDLDVFLPAETKAQVDRQPSGTTGAGALSVIVNADAAARVKAAVNGNPQARFNSMFPDGFNHAHVEILSSP